MNRISKNQNYHRAGSLNVGKRNKEKELIQDSDIQEFQDLPFRIKIETLPKEENYARLFFLHKEEERTIEVPEEITCVDVTLKNDVIKDLAPEANWFLITHSYKYNIYFDPKKKQRIDREYKIYSLNAGKNFTIYNYKKTYEKKDQEKTNRYLRKEKFLDELIETVVGVSLSESDDSVNDIELKIEN
ncbi:hypothetical protein C2G38_2163299 [Gigaspora rosea]|uniref:Uncharacterized protein n=1 Tax=Gigaspora rosea TaxID=44941 RepID=A0A397VXC3_9GLOM|nr:hypothetical protein C2G38_2163299 [Gigaspora rosea]